MSIFNHPISMKFKSCTFGYQHYWEYINPVILFVWIGIGFTGKGICEAYQPPIGIPAPEFGIEESVESIYGSEDFFTHYIDNRHPDATDENNAHGSPSKPRKTIPKNMTLAAGSVALIKGGPYNMEFNNVWTSNGTDRKPVFIRGSSTENKPRLFNAHIGVAGMYFIVENIEFYDDSYVRSFRETSHFAIRNCEIHNPIDKLIYYGAAISALGSDIVIYRNHIHHHITDDPTKGGDCHGVRPGIAAKRIWVLENDIHHNSGDAVQACHYCEPRPRFIYIGKNTLHEDRENAVDFKHASDIIVSQNKMYGYGDATTSDGSVVVLGSDGMPNRCWIIYNEIYDSKNGIRNEDTDVAWIIGNLIYNIQGFAISLEKKADDLYIIGNTVYNVGTAIDQLKPDRDSFRIHVFNNIFAHISGKKYNNHLNITSITIVDASEFSHNIFWQEGAPLLMKWGSTVKTLEFNSTADFDNFYRGENNRIEDPHFKDAANNNFQLTNKSAAIDQAIPHTAYDTFFELYGIDIKVDYSGAKRSQKGKWDIGAYEYMGNVQKR